MFGKPRGSFLLSGIAAIIAISAHLMAVNGGYTLVGWNNLGMHCMDSDYSVFSILPPYNTINAQLIDSAGRLVRTPTGVTVKYEALTDPSGSINTTSIGKTLFWQFVQVLYGAALAPDAGLAGYNMPSAGNVPQAMGYDSSLNAFVAEGIPLTPYDDAGQKNAYPMMHLVARDSSQRTLAFTGIVLPVSDEMDCRACHSSGSLPDAQPPSGWVHDPNPERDYRLNILLRHDETMISSSTYVAALQSAGYSTSGLYATVVNLNTPILCARCHASNALPGTGLPGIPALTASVHGFHAHATDPTSGLTLESTSNRSACYRCHPGSTTRCLRGAMGSAVAPDGSMAMQCQSCHGSMSLVGSSTRRGWLDEPNCQACHTGTAVQNSGQIRFTSALTSGGQYRVPANTTFATNPNTPGTGMSLFRFSRGHGSLVCSACHGSTHAEFPSSHVNDNQQSLQLQGHVGMISDCVTCHNGDPRTISGGPHGMHPVGQGWVGGHGDSAEGNTGQCATCHGADYRGTVLSRSLGNRTISTGFGTRTFWRGFQIGCYTCHNGPGSENGNSNRPPVVNNASVKAAAGTPTTMTLGASDPDGNPIVVRIVSQPGNGTVALQGKTATYYPRTGFAGSDSFTFAASDGSTDSNLGTITVSVANFFLFPFYQASATTYSGYALSNYSSKSATVEFSAFGPDGGLLPLPKNPATFTMPAQTQLAKLGSEIFGTGSSAAQSGWIQIATDNADLGSFFQFGSTRQLDGSVAFTETSKRFRFTRVFEGAAAFRGQKAVTFLSIANPTSRPVSLTLNLMGLQSGQTLAPAQKRTLPAKGFLFGSISSIFGQALTVSGGFVDVQVTDGDGAIGFELIQFPDRETDIGLNGVPDSSATDSYSAQLAVTSQYFTNLKLINTSDGTRALTLRAVAEDGSNLVPSVNVNLAAGQSLEQEIAQVLGLPDGTTVIGSLHVTADGPGVIGDVIFGDPIAMNFAAGLTLQTRSFTEAVFSQVANGDFYFTGLAFYNPNQLSTDITIDVYSENGVKTGQLAAPIQLGPGMRVSRLLIEWMPATAGQMRGYVMVRSTQPLIAQQLFGDTGMNFLSAVPPAVIR